MSDKKLGKRNQMKEQARNQRFLQMEALVKNSLVSEEDYLPLSLLSDGNFIVRRNYILGDALNEWSQLVSYFFKDLNIQGKILESGFARKRNSEITWTWVVFSTEDI